MKVLSLFKYILALAFSPLLVAHAQDEISSFPQIKFPQNLNCSIKKDTTYLKDFNRNSIANANFTLGHTSVFYRIFEYNKRDSLLFKNGEIIYLTGSNCYRQRNTQPEKNLQSFVKDGYYFLLSLCHCNTVKETECAQLAEIINTWTKEE